ncbi:MAG: hypothetical protein ACYCSF_11185 [Acidimicrobiales bacterium]
MVTNDGAPLDIGRLIGALDRHGVKYLLCGGAEVILVGQADINDAVESVLAVLRDAGRAEETVRRHQAVLVDGGVMCPVGVFLLVGAVPVGLSSA